jgi:16S rRNA U516 pseudouridylate synthase RsuA-like enzyme
MLSALDNAVTYLERVRFASIPLDPALSRGEWRPLSDGEIKILESLG